MHFLAFIISETRAWSGNCFRRQSHEGARIGSTSRRVPRQPVTNPLLRTRTLGTMTNGLPQPWTKTRFLRANGTEASVIWPVRYVDVYTVYHKDEQSFYRLQTLARLCVNAYRLKYCETVQVKFKNTLAPVRCDVRTRCVRAASFATFGRTHAVQVRFTLCTF